MGTIDKFAGTTFVPAQFGKQSRTLACAIAAALLAVACSSMPGGFNALGPGGVNAAGNGTAPSVAVLPGGGKSMQAFNADDIACRGTAQTRAHDNTTLPLAMGLGGVEVASSRPRVVVRDRTEDHLSTGSMFGNAPAVDETPLTVQQRYDTAYVQCMHSKGHQIPVGGAMSS